MPEKLLILAKGSPRDPEYAEQTLLRWKNEEPIDVPFFEELHKEGIKTLEKDLVVSCHGNTQLTLEYAQQIQKLADEGQKVAAIFSGGLYFALPSIIAANAPTVPIISIPLDAGGPTSYEGIDAFLAPQVPSGTAVIAGTGIAKYEVASKVTKEILTKEFSGVYLVSPTERLEKKLKELEIPILGEADKSTKEGLVLGCLREDKNKVLHISYTGNLENFDEMGDLGVFTLLLDSDPEEIVKMSASSLMFDCNDISIEQSVYVRGEDNLAFFAAKIMSQYNEAARNALKQAAIKKANSYEKRRITLDSFIGGN